MTQTLLGSAPTEERIIALISKFYMGATISLHENQTDFDIYNKKGKLSGVRVIKKGKRFRFERIKN